MDEVAISLTRCINTTPHAVVIQVSEDKQVVFEPDKAYQVRMGTTSTPLYVIYTDIKIPDQVPIKLNAQTAPNFTEPINMPPEHSDPSVTLIVAAFVGDFIRLNPAWWAGPVIGPNTGPQQVIRNKDGVITGSHGIVVYKRAT